MCTKSLVSAWSFRTETLVIKGLNTVLEGSVFNKKIRPKNKGHIVGNREAEAMSGDIILLEE